MDADTKKALAGAIRTLASILKSSEPAKPKPPRPAAAVPREVTELERVQRHFRFLQEHGEVVASGRAGPYGAMEWRFAKRRF